MMAADGGDGEVISFGDDDEDDDDMLDLFSFGAETVTTTATSGTDSTGGAGDPFAPGGGRKVNTGDFSEAMRSVMPLPPSNDDNDDRSQASEDSFIELLEQQQKEVTVVDASSLAAAAGRSNLADKGNEPDSDMQDILDWLDNDDERQGGHDYDEEELVFVEPPRPPPLAHSIPKPEPPPPPPKEYDSLEEAVKDADSSLFQIRRTLEKEKFVVPSEVRPWLWAKVICGKTLEEMLQSSIADSFQQWEEHWKENENSVLSSVSLYSQEGSADDTNETISNRQSQPQQTRISQQARKRVWLEKQSKILAQRIARVSGNGDLSQHEQDLQAILMNHEGNQLLDDTSEEGESGGPSWKDPLLPPVACAILSAGVPKVAAAVMLSQIISKFMPIVSLSMNERVAAAGVLHQQFYLLCSYHLPLLVLHLDKFIPGWFKWPPKGQLPRSWLVSHLAGEAEDGAIMNPQLLLCLWDLILTSSNNSLRYFLAMALLDHHAERLLLLTGERLKEEFHLVVSFSAKNDTEEEFDFTVESDGEISVEHANKCVRLWSDKALALWEDTPLSVAQKLKRLEDEAVNDALVARQKVREERLRLQQEAEAKAQKDAIEAEREKKENEARLRLTRARLVAFYRQQNPGKETNIDKIMQSYEGRYDILDAKLKQKYGVGFNPALKPKSTMSNVKIMPAMNSGFGGRRTFGMRKEDQDANMEAQTKDSVVVEVAASEVLPSICWSKEANQIKIQKLKKSSKLDNDTSERLPLKFYLVDCRPESSAQEEGRIPTSVSFTPDQLIDKDKVKAQEEMFESLRGAVHICVMGEGYAALPKLYGHKMTKGLAEFIKEDEVRISNCALFFLSRGFPFVSILEGGFAAAHSYLCQDGPKQHLYAKNVLTDYDPEVSIFAQFERATNSSSREKAQRSLQNMFDSGMTALTRSTVRFETLSSELSNPNEPSKPKVEQNVVRRFFGGNRDDAAGENASRPDSQENPPLSTESQSSQPSVPFRNPFARKSQTHSELNRSSHRNTSTGSEHSDTTNLDKEVAVVDTPSSSDTETKPDASSHNQMPGQSVPPQKTGGFAGLGAALNNSLKSSGQPQAARNPFARFGNIGSNAGTKNQEGKGPGIGSHFAGLNQFRKNLMNASESKAEPTIAPQPTLVALPPSDTQDEIGEVEVNSTSAEKPASAETKNNNPSTAEIAKV